MRSPFGVSYIEVSLKVAFGSRAIGAEYFHVVPLSAEIIKCTSVRLPSVEFCATAQYRRSSDPSYIAPRL